MSTFVSAHLPQPLLVSVRGCGNHHSLPPLGAEEVLQVPLEGLQAAEFLREIDGCNSQMGGISVQLLFQHLVDLVEGAQKHLKEAEDGVNGAENVPNGGGLVWSRTLYCGRVI